MDEFPGRLPFEKADIVEDVDEELSRARGILVEEDRELLSAPEEIDISEGGMKRRRSRMRKRIRHSMMDGSHLYFGLDEEEVETLFNPGGRAAEHKDDVLGGALALLRFIIWSLYVVTGDFESPVDDAIEDVEQRIHETAIDELLGKFDAGGPLTNSEVGRLLRSGEVPKDRWDELAERVDPETAEYTPPPDVLVDKDADPEP